jgi:rod shape-determining protein MreC
MDLIPQDAEVRVGQKVITSGLNQEFPPGLLIGEIIEILKDDSQSFQQARLKIPFQIRDLEKVFIVVNY